jgi:hypothetical protein
MTRPRPAPPLQHLGPDAGRAPHGSILTAVVAALCLPAACDADPTPTGGPTHPASAAPRPLDTASIPRVEHDFGTLRHGAVATVDLPIPVPTEGGPWIPVGFERTCTCAHHVFVLRDEAGGERAATMQPFPEYAVRDDETLVLRLSLVTAEKELADMPQSHVRGRVVLQSAGTADPDRFPTREYVEVAFTFAIDSPVSVRPAPVLAVGSLPLSRPFACPLALVPDDPALGFSDPRIVQPLPTGDEPADGVAIAWAEGDDENATGDEPGTRRLELTIEPRTDRLLGPFRYEVLVDASDGSTLRIPVTGQWTPDLEVRPSGRITFGRIPFDEPCEQSVVVLDHDLRRPADLHVLRVLDQTGHRIDETFQARVTLEGAGHDERARRLVMRFVPPTDGFDDSVGYVRGIVELGKTPEGPKLLEVPFVALRRR